MDCNSLSNISSGTNWPADVTNLCLKTPGCTAVNIYYSTSDPNEYEYCLNSASTGLLAETVPADKGPQGTACLGIYYACEWQQDRCGSIQGGRGMGRAAVNILGQMT